MASLVSKWMKRRQKTVKKRNERTHRKQQPKEWKKKRTVTLIVIDNEIILFLRKFRQQKHSLSAHTVSIDRRFYFCFIKC